MILQFIRNGKKIVGLALAPREIRVIQVPARSAEYWRVCDICGNDALVFCSSHAQYLCQKHLREHPACLVISISVARQLARDAMVRAEVEAG